MTLSFLQLNINSDNYWEQLLSFLSKHDFDIMHFQEVTGKDSRSGNINSTRDVFVELQKILAHKYNGELTIAERFTSGPDSYIGNATFYKKAFSLQEKHIIQLYKRETPFPSDAKAFDEEGRTMLHLKLKINGKSLSLLNAHGAWAKSPIEEPHQTKQGELLLNYVKQVAHPFIFSADMNLNPQQPLIQKLGELGENLTSKYHVTNTLNPRTHRAKHLFPPGIAVDFIFVSPDLTVNSFAVVEEDLSDHLGLRAEIEI